ncbi:MAG: hypothetical protein J5778_06175 [Clostridiales bacterium]|nr:hypothetical protein [Clostridiales bacterium]
MFQDSFVEYRVVRDNKLTGVAFKVVAVIATAMFIVFLNMISFIIGYNVILLTGSISVLIIAGVFLLLKGQYTEYEIEIVNDNFNGAKIKGKRKREELCDFSLKDCQFIGPVTSPKFSELSNKAIYKLNFTSSREYPVNDDVWCVMTSGNAPYMVIFEMKPDMYPVFRRHCPRYTAVYTKRVTETKEDKGED